MGGLAEGDEEEEAKDFAAAATDMELVDDALSQTKEFTVCGRGVPALAALVYFVHPYSILTCVGLSTLVIDHLFLAAAVLAAMQGRLRATGQSFAVAVLLSPYSVSLAPPLCLLLGRSRRALSVATTCLEMLKWTVVLQLASCAVLATIVPPAQSWEWIKAVYLFTFTVPDLTPNVGLFWYSSLFLCATQRHFRQEQGARACCRSLTRRCCVIKDDCMVKLDCKPRADLKGKSCSWSEYGGSSQTGEDAALV